MQQTVPHFNVACSLAALVCANDSGQTVRDWLKYKYRNHKTAGSYQKEDWTFFWRKKENMKFHRKLLTMVTIS